MFQGMSTEPSESTGPAKPEAAAGATADGKPSGGDQAKADAGAVAQAALKGAATGGMTGAAAGALKGAVKTKSGRYAIMAVIAAPILAVAMLANLVFGAVQASTAVPAGRGAIAQNAALTSFDNKDELRAIQDAATQAGASWEILAAIQKNVKRLTGDKGTGPFGIDMTKVSGEITEADANNFDKAALFVARKLKAASLDTVGTLQTTALDAGYMDTRGDKGENVLKPSEDEEAKKIREGIKKQYVAAISAMPLKNSEKVAESVFNAASSMATGIADKCVSSSVSVGTPSNASMDDKAKGYAQAIINQVAAKGMPERAAIIAIATALQESVLQMFWNPHVPGSLELADGGPEGGKDLTPPQISYSVGLFQQQVDGNRFSWGTVQDAMNPAKSADMFLNRLMTINGWQDLPVTVAAQSVQVSAFPAAYADDEVTARQMVSELKPTAGSYGTNTGNAGSGTVTAPAPTSGCPASSGSPGGVGVGVGKGDDYPYRDPVGVFTVEADPWSLFKRQCVSFVAWRMNVQMGWKEGQEYPFTPAKLGVGLFGNAVQWKDTVGSKYPMDTTPKVGAIAWFDANLSTGSTWTKEAGHVAVVSAVNGDGTVDIEEYNYNPLAYGTRKIPAAEVSGYIHVADVG